MKFGVKILPYVAPSAASHTTTKITAVEVLDTEVISLIDLNTNIMDIITITLI
jgi:hypothetical protein